MKNKMLSLAVLCRAQDLYEADNLDLHGPWSFHHITIDTERSLNIVHDKHSAATTTLLIYRSSSLASLRLYNAGNSHASSLL